MIAVGYEVASVPRARKDPTGPFKDSARWVRDIFDASGLTQDEFAKKIGRSRNALNKWMAGQLQPRWASREKLRRVAPPHLKDFADTDLRRTGHSALAQDAGHQVDGEDATGTRPMTSDAAYIAGKIDDITDPDERSRAVEGCLAALREARHPPKLDADKTGRAQRR